MNYRQLTSEQRYTISVLLKQGRMKKDIAAAIKVSPSTLSRELSRNSGNQGHYNWETAQYNAMYHRHRSPGNRAISPEVKSEVLSLLTESQWSPEQISGRLSREGIFVSHETIYRIIRKDKEQGGHLYMHCRHKLKHRSRPVGERRIPIPDRTSIRERPGDADGKRFGDWEMDTIVGKNNHGAILTLMERSNNFLLMRKLRKGKDARETALTVVRLLEPFRDYVDTITTDNGTEFACHKYITRKLGAKVYFADPHAPWQKGAVENGNGLVRQYIPKGTDFDSITIQKIKMIEYKINTRPRKKLNFDCPLESFYDKII